MSYRLAYLVRVGWNTHYIIVSELKLCEVSIYESDLRKSQTISW